jgi:hypothetical protein
MPVFTAVSGVPVTGDETRLGLDQHVVRLAVLHRSPSLSGLAICVGAPTDTEPITEPEGVATGTAAQVRPARTSLKC